VPANRGVTPYREGMLCGRGTAGPRFARGAEPTTVATAAMAGSCPAGLPSLDALGAERRLRKSQGNFARDTDSLLEGRGFEPSVPLAKGGALWRNANAHRGDGCRLEAVAISYGTEGPNFSRSAKESEFPRS
jgi:hypothetical protein